MSSISLFFTLLFSLWPLFIGFVILFIGAILKQAFWDNGYAQRKLHEKVEAFYMRYLSTEEYRFVRAFLEKEQYVILIKRNGMVQPYKYAVRPVNSQMFENFIVSGKATLHMLSGNVISDTLTIDSKLDVTKAIIGICKTKTTGLIFYPDSKREYHKIVSFLSKYKKGVVYEQSLVNDMELLKQKQQDDLVNSQRMQQFIKEFAEENIENNQDTNLTKTHSDEDTEAVEAFRVPEPKLEL